MCSPPTGAARCVTGTLVDGSIRRDDQLVVEPGAPATRVRGIQSLGAGIDVVEPGNRVALNLSGVSQDELHRGDCVVAPGRWRVSDRFDATLEVLSSRTRCRDAARTSRTSAPARCPSGCDCWVRRRWPPVNGRRSASSFPCRSRCCPATATCSASRGRDETIGGGEVLDIAPITKASHAAPDGTVERAIAERGWVDVGELELLTGVAVEPAIGHWATTPVLLEQTRQRLQAAIDAAGEHGVDTAAFADHERAVVATLEGVIVEAGRARSRRPAIPTPTTRWRRRCGRAACRPRRRPAAIVGRSAS